MKTSYSETTQTLKTVTQVIWYLLGFAEILLLFRFLLKLFIANPDSVLTQFIYTITNAMVIPFTTVFQSQILEENIFEWTTLLAMGVYALIAWGVTKLIFAASVNSQPETTIKKIHEQKNS